MATNLEGPCRGPRPRHLEGSQARNASRLDRGASPNPRGVLHIADDYTRQLQCLVHCLQVLYYLWICTDQHSVCTEIEHVGQLFDWKQLYFDLVSEQCIWDFKDLFLASAALFGDGPALIQLFGTDYAPEVVDLILKDWSRPCYDESSTMGLLDLFASWVLQTRLPESTMWLLFEHARALAGSVEHNDPRLMMSRPFIRWLLAKSRIELPGLQKRPDGVTLDDFDGLFIRQASHTTLPVFVPIRHAGRPDWDFFYYRTTPEQRRVAEVAAGAAHHIGDYGLQADALKLHILQSRDPRKLMDTLANLQLEIQGDREGYFATCLSRYLVATEPAEEVDLLRRLEKPGHGRGTFDFEQCHNASLVWAWSMIRVQLSCSVMENGSGTNGDGRGSSSIGAQFLEKGIRLEEWKLPSRIRDFTQYDLGIPI
ncbi:hypothetical protein C8A00DRAFT_16402, partial [Chaetomidium leptoderma]